MLRSIFLYLIFFIMILGEKKLFYNSEGLILYNITSSKVEVIKKKKLEIDKDVNLREVLLKKDIIHIKGADINFDINYIEYDINKNVYNVYFTLYFFDGRFSVSGPSDKTIVMGVYDDSFNYIDIKEHPILKSDLGVEVMVVRSEIKIMINPVIMDKEKKNIFGVNFKEKNEGAEIYKKSLESNKVEIIKSFNNNILLKSLIDNDKKLIYSTFDSFLDDNLDKQVSILDLKNMKISEIVLDGVSFKEFCYSNEIKNTNKELIEKFYKSK